MTWRRPRRTRLRLPALWLGVLLGLLGGQAARAAESSFEDRPVDATDAGLQGPLERAVAERERVQSLFPRLKSLLSRYPNFIADTELRLDFRTFAFPLRERTGDEAHAWTAGGKFAFRTGWHRERFQIGAGVYTSFPIVEDDPLARTDLLRAGGGGFAVFGEAFATLRLGSSELSVGRMELDLPYVNRNDSRMAPNSFQGVFGKGVARGVPLVNRVDWTAAYVSDIRPRNENEFQSMSERAGAPGTDRGMALAGVQFRPRPGISIGAYDYLVFDTFNTAYVAVETTWKLDADWSLAFEWQATHQTSVGDERIGDFSTWVSDGRVALSYRSFTGWVAASRTGPDAGIRSPYGAYPGLVSLMQSDFNRASETAWVLGAAAAPRIWPRWSGFVQMARGTGGVDPLTGADGVDEQSLDLTVDYRIDDGAWKGLWFRARGSVLDSQGSPNLAWQVRLILNYTLPVL